MKQKITIKLSVCCDKSRREAMKTASKHDGVLSIELQGEDKLVVTGDGVDAVELIKSLRKKVGCLTLIGVEEVKEKKEEKKEPEKKEPEKDCPKICCGPCDRICPKKDCPNICCDPCDRICPKKDCPKICCDPYDRICPKPFSVPMSYCDYYDPSPNPCSIM